ncbi:peptidase inhibitor family I36 protein [Actinoplanes sp. NPDC051494]|uniref:peptidase inhibitor family I36 protein n=1 Tax=Actinoplanes sp. NPDC051494 TaxID=3363907 RepID=UPI0037A57841
MSLLMPTGAQASESQCRTGQLCLFEKANFSGGFKRVMVPADNGRPCDALLAEDRYDNGNLVDDHTSSVINKTSYPAILTVDSIMGGKRITMPANSKIANLADRGMDNKISSACA